MDDETKHALKGKATDGIVGFLTSKRAIAAVVGIIATMLVAWKGIDIDAGLREQIVANIWKISTALIGGFSLSDTFGKGKVAAEMRANLAGLLKSGLDVVSAVASKTKDAPDGGAGDAPA